MKERGMIFNGEMTRAILDGRKTQTRRIMKVQPSEDFTPMNMALETDYKARWYTPGVVDKDGYLQPASKKVFGVSNENEGYSCPFGAVGDRIWVRETWARYNIDQNSHDIAYRATTPADWPEEGRWRPSIHMPRWASRILLEITNVRVERLNAISEEDAEAEGIDMEALYDSQDCYDCIADHNMTGRPTVTGAFKYLWESIYGEEGWKSNPWVWVIEFKRIEGGAA
ncbi:TPA: morphogenetic protein [Klebsiella pneumoniae]|uniref:morphogenetic protein n=1 Tax=Klebsiella pneumoniae TaxID=573 RepID=UPI000F68FBEE|nr:morphogenetic protein [Klebsiella pneumoniae]MEC4515879.1 morphogenetic protein [Klebsiella pneumoniae]RRY55917.1 morphogenetic protein [Klebsiella pneumoniae]RRY97418.1 morphogenetic protein [Klebsiella pneumoniae]HBR5527454.1 morphogenetic protein [Klebsiella pneumoniae]HBR5583899.1 morphogenetic protein [Klebsiella pneumoniae]